MTNNERFNAMLNSCGNPRAVYGALSGLAGADEYRLIDMIRKAKDPARALTVAVEAILKEVRA